VGSFVVASPRVNASTRICLRTYRVSARLPSKVTVIEAALAACATPAMFAPISSGSGYRKIEYIGAGLGANNPIREVITEAHLLFGGDSRISCILSLGIGNPGIIMLPLGGGNLSLQTLHDMMDDCEQRAQEIDRQIGHLGVYFRFSVEQGMQNNQPDETIDPNWVMAQTTAYLEDHTTNRKIGTFIQNSTSTSGPVTLDHLGV